MKYSYCLLFLFLFSCKKDVTTEVVITPIQSTSTKKDTVNVFMGYKIDPNAKRLGPSYWKQVPVLCDIIASYFHKIQPEHTHIGNAMNSVSGDFNGDGYIDVFCPGKIYAGSIDNDVGFLIWNQTTKIFEYKNLFNDKSQMSIIINASKVIPLYLNNDNYVDLIIFGFIDEGISNFYSLENIQKYSKPVSLAISDGNGGYDLKPIKTEESVFWHTGGDVGDLNGDGIVDLVINYGPMMRIMWGINEYPYFTNENSATFNNNPEIKWVNNNGFGEECKECTYDAGDCLIADMNNDGQNDLIVSSAEDLYSSELGPKIPKVLINQGKGKFNKNSIIKLPFYGDGTNKPIYNQTDFAVEDINNDGKKDIIVLNHGNYVTWNFYVLFQQSNNTYMVDKNTFLYTINDTRLIKDWKPKLIFSDFNGDGKKDISYYDGVLGDINRIDDPLNIMIKKRSVFIRKNNQYVEEDIYQYDSYMKSLLYKVK